MLLFLNDIDHAIYQKFKNGTYIRYMDDMVMVCETVEDAKTIYGFIRSRLALKGL